MHQFLAVPKTLHLTPPEALDSELMNAARPASGAARRRQSGHLAVNRNERRQNIVHVPETYLTRVFGKVLGGKKMWSDPKAACKNTGSWVVDDEPCFGRTTNVPASGLAVRERKDLKSRELVGTAGSQVGTAEPFR